MGILDFFRRREIKSTITLQNTGVQSLAKMPRTDLTALIGNYRTDALVRGCVIIKANQLKEPRLIVQERATDGAWEEAVGHPMRRLLRRPNPKMDEDQFISFCQKSIDVAGLTYCEIVPGNGNIPAELWPLQPDKVKPIYGQGPEGERVIDYYEWKDGRYSKDIPAELMLMRDDLELGGTLSPLAAAIREVDMDQAQTDYIRSFFNNAGVPSGIITIKGRSLMQDEANEIRSRWRAQHGRESGNQHDIVVMDENAEYQRLGAMLGELDSDSVRGFSESRITMGFGVPPLILYAYFGLLRATYNNLPEAWKQFWVSTMSAEMGGWRSFFELNLLPMYYTTGYEPVLDEQVRLYWDTSEVKALQENEDASHTRHRENWLAGGTTLDEFREGIGLAEFPDAELGKLTQMQWRSTFKLTTGGTALPAGGDAEDGQTAATGKAQPFFAKDAKREARQIILDKQTKAEFDQREELIAGYGEEIQSLAEDALDGKIEKEEFVSELRKLAQTSLVASLLMGMLLAGDDELTDEELASIDETIAAANESASNLGDDIYNGRYGGVYAEDGETGEDVGNRVALWTVAAYGAYAIGQTRRRDDPYLMWLRGPTSDSCDTCINQEGMVMTSSDWRDSGLALPQSSLLDCGGWYCLCGFREVIVD